MMTTGDVRIQMRPEQIAARLARIIYHPTPHTRASGRHQNTRRRHGNGHPHQGSLSMGPRSIASDQAILRGIYARLSRDRGMPSTNVACASGYTSRDVA